MKRLFLAVDLDDRARAAVARLSSDLRVRVEKYVRLSWVRPDHLHLTLRFFGQADEATEQRLCAALAEPLAQAPFEVSFEGVGCFPAVGPPRVLWLGLRGGLVDLDRLHRALRRRLREPAPEAAFTPHLTLGRFRKRARRGVLAEIADIPASAGPCLIDRVTLYESQLSSDGPVYHRLLATILTPSR